MMSSGRALLLFFSLELDDTSDEFSSSGSEVEMKVAKPRKKAEPASPVSFAFSSRISVDSFLFCSTKISSFHQIITAITL